MTINELPFFALLIVSILPITIGLIIFARLINMVIGLVINYKKDKSSIMLSDFGELLLFLVFFNVIINVILFIIGSQPEDFDMFTYLIVEQLPNAWYAILLYGILVQLSIFFQNYKEAPSK